MVVPCQYGPQKVIIAFKKIFLFWVTINIQKDWKEKLESAYSFMLKYSKITVCQTKLVKLMQVSMNVDNYAQFSCQITNLLYHPCSRIQTIFTKKSPLCAAEEEAQRCFFLHKFFCFLNLFIHETWQLSTKSC